MSLPPVPLRDASTGATPRLRTSLRLGFRDGVLLVRFDGRDAGTVATLRRRDEALWNEDVYEVFLSPVDPPSVYFELEINPLGTLLDARVESPDLVRATMRVDFSWNLSGLRGESRVRDNRWSAVLKIPLAPLAPDGIPEMWRANFYRIDRGAAPGDEDEFSAWSPILCSPPDFHQARRFGLLRLPVPG